MSRSATIVLVVSLVAGTARAEEGMWTYDNFPIAQLKKKYGFEVTQAWLDSARRSSVRLAGGCSGSFVSENGLVMTNHHCVRACIQQISTKDRDYSAGGFVAQLPEQEMKCPEIELNELLQMSDVTKRVRDAVKQLKAGSPEYGKKQKEAKTAIEKECAGGDEKLRCDVVDLYRGGVHSLYKYRRYLDVRLVFAPEQSAAKFGGDPDNFNFPRYGLDMSFVRAWDEGRPVKPQHWFKWSEGGAKEGELVFVSGHPGSTRRMLTVAEYQQAIQFTLPEQLIALAEWRGQLEQFGRSGPERARITTSDRLSADNAYKAITGRYAAIREPQFLAAKAEEEKKLRAAIKASPKVPKELQKRAGAAFDLIQKKLEEYRPRREEYQHTEESASWHRASLVTYAKTLLRLAVELPKPEGERLREYRDTAMPSVKQTLFSKAPVQGELEKLKITFGLTKLRERLGPDHAFVKKVLGARSPEEIAEEIVGKSTLGDPTVRQQLFNGGKAALDASTDPAIVLARIFDEAGRSMRKWHDDDIEAPLTSASEAIAEARFALQGTAPYPDATFTLRLSFGTVKGWEEGGRTVRPFTDFAGAYERNTGRPPFKLPDSFVVNKDRVALATPFDFTTDNDIIGGNSGSPMFNQSLEIVGLVFDGNLPSLGGDYFFDASKNRTVGVHSRGMIEALQSIYGAKRVVDELRTGKRPPGAG